MNTPTSKTVQNLITAIIRDGLQEDARSLAMRSRQLASKLRTEDPEFAAQIRAVLGGASALRSTSGAHAMPIPVDADSRQKLLREQYPVVLDAPPVLPSEIEESLAVLINEQSHTQVLVEEGLAPTRSLLMTGPPGCGKTTTAAWVAQQLDLPLFTLDLATVMSSYLGKTGSNIRAVLNHAHQVPCVLLLDEFDAIAKRRDDDSDVGELKRLVTVLLQAIDEWPVGSVLIAATNHGDLLDPAVWRRFDMVIEFPAPTENQVSQYLARVFDPVIGKLLSKRLQQSQLLNWNSLLMASRSGRYWKSDRSLMLWWNGIRLAPIPTNYRKFCVQNWC